MEMYELRRGGHVKRIERQVEPQREMIAVRHNDRDRRNVVRNGQSVNLNDRISFAANTNPLDPDFHQLLDLLDVFLRVLR